MFTTQELVEERVDAITAHEAKAFFQTELVFLAVFFGNFSPIARHMAGEEVHR